MRRRDALPFMLALCAASLRAQGLQPGKVYRIGLLTTMPLNREFPAPKALFEGFRQLGWIEGQNYILDAVHSGGPNERLPGLAAELVQRKVDLIIAGGTPHAQAAKAVTSAIPTVFWYVGDPVGAGLVASLARPGGNVTGLGGLSPAIYVKQLELLKEVVPGASRIAMLFNPSVHHAAIRAETESAAQSLRVTLRPVELRSPEQLDDAFAAVARDKVDALLILGQPFLFGQRARLAKFAIDQRLAAIIGFEEVAEAGVLMSYGDRVVDAARRLPHYVDRILKGAKPAELPVEQPTRFYLTVNLKTAKAIGLTVPSPLLQRADRVIE